MTKSALRAALLALVLVAGTSGAATAAQLLVAKSLACGGTGPQSGTITASERNGVVTLKIRASGLVPGQPVTCGYTCGQVFTAGTTGPCGAVNASGRISTTIQLSLGTCFGFIPFFDTPTTGKCVASALP